ncbi:hypothetical protein UlMin_035782 [Ulmus minor]
MHVAGVTLDLNWFLQFILTVFVIAVGLLHLVKNTASKYFEVDANFEGGEPVDRTSMPGMHMEDLACVVCGNPASKKCSRCKAVRYCSTNCQEVHWKSGHKSECKIAQSPVRVISSNNALGNSQLKTSGIGGKKISGIALIPSYGTSAPKPIKQPKEILFPYDEFVKLFNWDKPGFPPCGLLNCGNSCFANAVLQCLAFTRPLVAYLLEKGHRSECIRDDWCFLCEFQTHLERVSQSSQAFSPTNIISRLPNIGGNLGYGRQEDAHEFMRFAIDTMQSVCLDEFGGEKAVPPSSQETTIIQHIFGGHLQSQVICTECNNISNQYENMMDLTVEIHGEAASLEECLDQFTVKEWLHGDNMYKCDGCNDYVKAWKRLTVKLAPNILTVALKRFQSGRFGKLNKRVTFPETLDLSPYMSDTGDGSDVYKLYAVVVHVDMLNASFFGHYICYTKDFRGNWYRVDDCKVKSVELEEVLSQGAYMLLYSRVQPRPTCHRAQEPSKLEQQQKQMIKIEVEPKPEDAVEYNYHGEFVYPMSFSRSLSSDSSTCPEVGKEELCAGNNAEATRQNGVAILESTSSIEEEASNQDKESGFQIYSASSRQVQEDKSINSCVAGPFVSNGSEKVPSTSQNLVAVREASCQAMEEVPSSVPPSFLKDNSVSDCEATNEGSKDTEMVDCDSCLLVAKTGEINSNGHAQEDEIQIEHVHEVDPGLFCSSSATSQAETHPSKRSLPFQSTNFQNGNGMRRVEIMSANDDSL